MRLACVIVAALCALDGALYNTDMYAAPDPAEQPGPGQVVTYHQGVGEVAAGYFKQHAPGEVAEFHLFVPDGLAAGERYPLLIVYHGGKDGGSGRGFAKAFGRLSSVRHPCFVLSPNMYTIDGFDEIMAEGKYPIDPQRIVVMGFSSGGMGCGAALRGFTTDPVKHPFAAFVMMSTFGRPPKDYDGSRPVVVVAGEHETPAYAKHPALKQRRDQCRAASLTLLGTVREARYIEMQGHGHTAGKPEHLNVLRNLLRGIGTDRFRFAPKRPRAEAATCIALAAAERWAALRAELDRLEAGPKLAHVTKTVRSKLGRELQKWVTAQVKTLRALRPTSSHLAKTQALHTHDHLRALAKAFTGHAWAAKLDPALAKLDGATQLAAELQARTRWEAAVRGDDRAAMRAALEALRAELPATEYGHNRTRETLLALGG